MDYRLQVFLAVAHHLSFTKAAEELHISQPAVSRHITQVEAHHGVQLFERIGGRIKLTAAGTLFLAHAEQIAQAQRALELALSHHTGSVSGTLSVGASSTIAQYILPRFLAEFINHYPHARLSLRSGNSAAIEAALEAHQIDLGLVEGSAQHAGLRYTPWRKDELVLVTSTRNTPPQADVSPEMLCRLPLVLREEGSGTLQVIEKALAKHQIKFDQLNLLLQLGSTEAIKSFLLAAPTTYAIVSVAAVARELLDNRLQIVETTGLALDRSLSLVSLHGEQNSLADRFAEFLSHNPTL